jgi:hypothetical protein
LAEKPKGEEEIGEEWMEEGSSASQRGPERPLPNTRAYRAHHHRFLWYYLNWPLVESEWRLSVLISAEKLMACFCFRAAGGPGRVYFIFFPAPTAGARSRFFFLPPQRGRDLNSKTINQTAALPIRLHTPAHFAAGVSEGGERGRDRPKERGGSLPVQVSPILCPWPVSSLSLPSSEHFFVCPPRRGLGF